MRESCTSGSVRGVLSNEHPYRDRAPSRFDCHASLTARAVPTRSVANGGHGAQSAPLPTLRFNSSGTRRNRKILAVRLKPNARAALHSCSSFRAASSRTIL